MDFRKPLVALLKAAFLNPPLFFGVSRVEGLGGKGSLGVGDSFLIFTPEGPGVTASFLILEVRGVTTRGVAVLTVCLTIFLSKFSKGASTMASFSSGSGAPTPSGGMFPIVIRLVRRACSLPRGLTILTVVASEILGFFRIKCFSAANCPALFRRAL